MRREKTNVGVWFARVKAAGIGDAGQGLPQTRLDPREDGGIHANADAE
jgi:hypothetical protein